MKKTGKKEKLVSFAAVFRVVTQRSPTPLCEEERCVTTLKTAAKETRRRYANFLYRFVIMGAS